MGRGSTWRQTREDLRRKPPFSELLSAVKGERTLVRVGCGGWAGYTEVKGAQDSEKELE